MLKYAVLAVVAFAVTIVACNAPVSDVSVAVLVVSISALGFALMKIFNKIV